MHIGLIGRTGPATGIDGCRRLIDDIGAKAIVPEGTDLALVFNGFEKESRPLANDGFQIDTLVRAASAVAGASRSVSTPSMTSVRR